MSKTEEVKHKQAQETLRKCEHFEPEKDPSIHPSKTLQQLSYIKYKKPWPWHLL